MQYQKLFDHLSKEHGLTLLESEMRELVLVLNEAQADEQEQVLPGVLKRLQALEKKCQEMEWYNRQMASKSSAFECLQREYHQRWTLCLQFQNDLDSLINDIRGGSLSKPTEKPTTPDVESKRTIDWKWLFISLLATYAMAIIYWLCGNEKLINVLAGVTFAWVVFVGLPIWQVIFENRFKGK